jgi:hypothetical protein
MEAIGVFSYSTSLHTLRDGMHSPDVDGALSFRRRRNRHWTGAVSGRGFASISRLDQGLVMG